MSVLWSFSLFVQISLFEKHLPQFLGVSILDQPVVELNGLNKVLNGDSLVEPMEPFRIILCHKGRAEPENCQNIEQKAPALLPVYLLHKMLIVLRVRVGYQGARSNVALRKHLKLLSHFQSQAKDIT